MSLELPQGQWMTPEGAPSHQLHHWADQVNRDVALVRTLVGGLQAALSGQTPASPGETPTVPSDINDLIAQQTAQITQLETDIADINARLDAIPEILYYEEFFSPGGPRPLEPVNHNLGTQQLVYSLSTVDSGQRGIEAFRVWIEDDNTIQVDITDMSSQPNSWDWGIHILGVKL